MSRFFFTLTIIYVAATAAAGATALRTTLWAYNLDNRMLSDMVTAAIINTAAAVAAMGFFGGFDMLFTIWQFLRNQEAERARNQERDEERKQREEERKAQRAEREEIMAMLRVEHQQNQELTARVLALSDLVINRANGHDANGDGENNRGE